jgi:drug/metabolite transporter (DMT)-like permease
MWFFYSLLALTLLVTRRGSEKSLADKIPSTAMALLQQLTALPFMAMMLPFAVWFSPFTLDVQVVLLLLLHAVLTTSHLFIYYKAVQVGDISIIAPLISLTAGTSILGAYIFLDQPPTLTGLTGALLILVGAYMASKTKRTSMTAINNRLAVILTVIDVFLLGFYTPVEVTIIRKTNVVYFNFVSSVLAVTLIYLMILLWQNKTKTKILTKKVYKTLSINKVVLLFIGFSMAFNMYFTYSAKSLAPNAGYVTAIKSVQILPLMLIGVFAFKEKVTRRQWVGALILLFGLFVLTWV